MTRNVRLVFWAAAAVAVALAVIFGPLWAGYAVAAVTLMFIGVLMGMRVFRAIDEWHLDHPLRIGHRHSRSGGHDERRAA